MNTAKDILLCELDVFFVSVEQLDRPELAGKPVFAGGNPVAYLAAMQSISTRASFGNLDTSTHTLAG